MGTSSVAEKLFEMDQDMAAYENQTFSLAEDVIELENAVDEAVDQVNGDIAKNLADIVEISEDIGQQERRISSLEEDMEEQKNVFHTVNWGVSKNRVDIGEISRDMALQRN